MTVQKMITTIQLLVLLHVSRGFVLLTANIDDIRKLAMKFVPAAMASQISEFLSQTATQVIRDHPIEFNKDLSKENKEYNHKYGNRYDYRKDANIFGELEGTSKYGPGKYTLNNTLGLYTGSLYSDDDKSKTNYAETQDEENHSGLNEKEQSGVKSDANSVEGNDISTEFNNTISVIHSNPKNDGKLITTGGDEALTRGRTDEVNEDKSDDISRTMKR